MKQSPSEAKIIRPVKKFPHFVEPEALTAHHLSYPRPNPIS